MPLINIEEKRAYQRQWLAKRRATFFADKACVTCGSTERLELDHIDPKEKTSHRIWSWAWPRILAEAAKCQVLCYDCHKKKTAIDQGRMFTLPIRHGNLTDYKKGCRCQECKAAYRINRHAQYLRTGT